MLNKFKRRRKIGGKGVGEGTRKTACLKTSIFELSVRWWTGNTDWLQGARKDGRGNEPVGSCAMRGVLGRERLRGRTVEKWRVKTKFCSTYKVQLRMNGKTFFVAVGSGHLYTICKLSVLNNRIFVSQIKVNICEIN